MATYVPAKKATEYIFYVSLESQAAAGTFQTNPTLASGDVTVSKDGGTAANITTLPTVTPAGGKRVKVTLSSTEMNADNVSVVFSDAAGDEWYDLMVNIPTAANQLDDVASAVTTVDTVVDGIKAVTDNLPDSGALTTIDANIDAILADTGTDGVVVASASKTGYSLSADQSGVTVGTVNALGTQAKADVNAEVDTALTDYDAPTATEMTAAFTEIKGATWASTDTLEAIRDRGDVAWTTADVASALATYDAPTKAELDAAQASIEADIASLNNLDSMATQAAAAAALTAYDPPTKAELDLAQASIESNIATVDANVDAILDDTGTSGVVVASVATDAIDAAAIAASAVSELQSGLATASTLSTVATNVAAILADTGTDGVVISTATAQAIADEVLKRGVGDGAEDTASVASLTELILLALESSATGATLTIRKTDGTTFSTKTLTTDDTAEPITGIT